MFPLVIVTSDTYRCSIRTYIESSQLWFAIIDVFIQKSKNIEYIFIIFCNVLLILINNFKCRLWRRDDEIGYQIHTFYDIETVRDITHVR